MSAKQVDELSKQFNAYEKRVREAIKQFDVKGREAKAKGRHRLEKFTARVKRSGQQFEKQFKSFVSDEGRVLNQGLNDLFAYFRTLANKPEPRTRAGKTTGTKSAKPRTKKTGGTRSSRSNGVSQSSGAP